MNVIAGRPMKVMTDRRCRSVKGRISEVVLSGELLSPDDERHVGQCLACQAEVAQFKMIERGFSAMRDQIATAPPDLVNRVMAGLDRTPIPWFRRRVAVSVSAVSAVAVAATVAVAMRRRQAAA
jgi:anti-sigma factor RsiW